MCQEIKTRVALYSIRMIVDFYDSNGIYSHDIVSSNLSIQYNLLKVPDQQVFVINRFYCTQITDYENKSSFANRLLNI